MSQKVRFRESRGASSPAVPEAGRVLSPWSQARARGEPGCLPTGRSPWSSRYSASVRGPEVAETRAKFADPERRSARAGPVAIGKLKATGRGLETERGNPFLSTEFGSRRFFFSFFDFLQLGT